VAVGHQGGEVRVHTPYSGTVTAIELRPLAAGKSSHGPCLIVQTDFTGSSLAQSHNDVHTSHQTPLDKTTLAALLESTLQQSPQTLLKAIAEQGIVGLGGAGYPTAQKLIASERTAIETLIINGAECEPYITADDTLMQTHPNEVVAGAMLLAHIVKATTILIAIEDNKPAATEALRAAALDCVSIPTLVQVVSIPTRYPSGGERQLIDILLGKEVPSGGLPADIGVLVHNPATARACLRAVALQEPLTHRVVTVTGEGVAHPGNYCVAIGTPIDTLLRAAGWESQTHQRVVHGGPMMGFLIDDPAAPITKITNCIVVPSDSEWPTPPPEQPCIRCGHCAEVCPASLLPQQLYWFAKAADQDNLEAHHLFDCIECGACAYVCPSNIPLVQYYRHAKQDIREHSEAARRAEHARRRFEARQARLEREQAERDAKRAQRKAAVTADTVQAVERGGVEDDPVQAAIARVNARKAAKEQAPSTADTAHTAGQRGVEDDPVQAAIARVQAPKSAQGRGPEPTTSTLGSSTSPAPKEPPEGGSN
jgi:electron transport complex protein RnfC